MNRHTFLKSVLVLLVTQGIAGAHLAAQTAGVVVDVHGKCFVRRASDSSQKDQPIRSSGEKLFVEDQLRCDKGGALTLNLGYLTKTLGPSTEEYAVPLAPSQPPNAEQRVVAQAFIDFGKLGGRNRSAGGVLYSPPADGCALAQSMVVRWNPWPGANKVMIRIETQSHRELFRQIGVNGTGDFTSKAMLDAVQLQQKADANGELLLSIFAGDNSVARDQVEFKLLAPAQENSLKQDLERADTQDSPIVRHIVRAFAFSSRLLWSEAASEYEAAVKESPGSTAVLERAVRAEADTGNVVRQGEFEQQLQRLEESEASGRP
jgi:hypothetical protein